MSRISWRVLSPWLDVLAIAAWGFALMKLWLSGQMLLLIHPAYKPLTIGAGFVLLFVSAVKGWFVWRASRNPNRQNLPPMQHLSLFPPGWSSALLLGVAIAGLVLTPRPFASQTAFDRGVSDSITMTRVRPQSFTASAKTEDKSLIDWIRTLQVYPEPDAYTGQKARVQGFVIHPPNLPAQYFLITRFVITCCAADVYPVSLPVKVPTGDRNAYKVDSWLEVEGKMITETFDGKRQLTIQATNLKPIPEPQNPYDY